MSFLLFLKLVFQVFDIQGMLGGQFCYSIHQMNEQTITTMMFTANYLKYSSLLLEMNYIKKKLSCVSLSPGLSKSSKTESINIFKYSDHCFAGLWSKPSFILFETGLLSLCLFLEIFNWFENDFFIT